MLSLGLLFTTVLVTATPKAGDLAPDFTVVDTEGTRLTLTKLLKNGPVIVAFFPKAFTGG